MTTLAKRKIVRSVSKSHYIRTNVRMDAKTFWTCLKAFIKREDIHLTIKVDRD